MIKVNRKLFLHCHGQSLLEVIVAMAIFGLITAAMTSMALGGFRALEQGGEQTVAEGLAQEAIEAVRSIRDGAYNELIYNQSGISTSTGQWLFTGEGTDETIGDYTRTITVSDVCRDLSDDIIACPGSYIDVHTKEVTVTVSWITQAGITNSINQTTYLTNWDSQNWIQSDWVGGTGQTIWSNITRYDTDDGNIENSVTGEVFLDQTVASSGTNDWPFDTPSNYTYDSGKIEVTGGNAQLLAGGGGDSGETVDDGFEWTTDTSYDWPFTTAGNYTYDSDYIEVTGGVAQLKALGGTTVTGETVNEAFATSTSGWTFNTWDAGGGEVDPTGSWQSTGGNPSGYADIDIPFNAENDELGGYWEQSIVISENSATVTCYFDWSIVAWTAAGGVDDYQVYVFLDSATGEPTIGNEIWSSGTQSGTTSWSGQQTVDCSSAASTSGTYYYKVAVWLDTAKNQDTGPITFGMDNAKVYWEKSGGGSSYSTTTPDIYPTSSYSAPGVVSWDSFTETATKNGGEIYYQLSSDDGTTWQYFNGSSWATAGASNYNTASVINTNISSFATSTEQIKFRAYLESDGTQLVQLDNVNIGLTPPTAVWSFSDWGVGGGEVTPTGSRQSSGGNPDSYADITVPLGSSDEVGGYWEQAFLTTDNNPEVTLDFDYKTIDFNGTPNLAEIRFYVDTATGDPVTQVGSAITISGEGSWTSTSTIDVSSAVTTAGTYYLKMALWVETAGGGGSGPLTVGFDNVDLNWSLSNYPQDRPTIYNTSSFEPSVISSWTSFVETASKDSGEIYYQLSDDDGATWQYWNGAAWTTISTSTNYNTATDVNSYISNFDTANKKFMFKAYLESDGTNFVQLDNIQVGYDITSSNYYGNRFVVDSVDGAGLMSTVNDKIDMRFTAKNTKTVNAIRVYLEQEKGTSPTYRYGLQSDSSGEPSGTWLGATNSGYGDLAATATGWQTITLGETVDLVQDTTYHLVVEYQTGTIGGGNAIEIRRSSPANFLNAYDSSSNPQANVLFSDDNGSIWTVQGYQPIYVLDFNDATYEGNPYNDLTEYEIYGANFYGEEFTPSSEIIVSELGALISENNSAPPDDLFITLYDVDGATELSSGVIATGPDLTINVYSWQSYTLPLPVTLEAGNTYRVYLSSASSTAQKYYLTRAATNNNSAVYNGINYDGTGSFFVGSTDSGSSWTPTNNADLFGFRFPITIYESSGYLISSAYDTGSPSIFNIIEWDQVTPSCSPDCEVKFQIQTAPDNGGSPGTWSATWCGPDGEDGDETDYYTTSTSQMIHTDHNGDQWVRYKATLSGDTTDTPTLEEIRVNYK